MSWLEDWTAAQSAARHSGKFIVAYIYQRGQAACVMMERNTFPDERAVAALAAFETLALNGDAQSSRAFCEHYKVGTSWNQGGANANRAGFSALPAYLFLDATGREYFRAYGYYPPDTFVQLLGQVTQLIGYQCALAQRPQDARLRADMGHLYMVMGRPELADPLLKEAVQLDPENTTGARADAELDQLILSIPDDPALAFRNLVAFQFNRPDTKRGLEVRYYMAVAQLAAGKEEQAEKILLDFEAIPPFLPDDSRLPGLQYGYLVESHDRQVGFWDIDDLDKVKQAVRDKEHDPAKCTFTRKAINPAYRNQWTGLAALLLKQYREAPTAPQPPPK